MSNVRNLNKDENTSVRGQFRRLDAVLAVRDTALTALLIKTLEEHGLALTEELLNDLYDVAEQFPNTTAGQYFYNEAAKRRPPSR